MITLLIFHKLGCPFKMIKAQMQVVRIWNVKRKRQRTSLFYKLVNIDLLSKIKNHRRNLDN